MKIINCSLILPPYKMTPENDLARKAVANPDLFSQQEKEIWYCTAYVSAIAYQIEEVIANSSARPVRQIAESEGKILEKTQLLILLITALSLLSTALGVSNLVSANIMERSSELGLLKAIGATNLGVILLIIWTRNHRRESIFIRAT